MLSQLNKPRNFEMSRDENRFFSWMRAVFHENPHRQGMIVDIFKLHGHRYSMSKATKLCRSISDVLLKNRMQIRKWRDFSYRSIETHHFMITRYRIITAGVFIVPIPNTCSQLMTLVSWQGEQKFPYEKTSMLIGLLISWRCTLAPFYRSMQFCSCSSTKSQFKLLK